MIQDVRRQMTKSRLSSKNCNNTHCGFGPNPSSRAKRRMIFTELVLAIVAAGTALYLYAISVLNSALSFFSAVKGR